MMTLALGLLLGSAQAAPDPAGTYELRTTVTTLSQAPVVGTIRVATHSRLHVTIEPDGEGYRQTQDLCEVTVVDDTKMAASRIHHLAGLFLDPGDTTPTLRIGEPCG